MHYQYCNNVFLRLCFVPYHTIAVIMTDLYRLGTSNIPTKRSAYREGNITSDYRAGSALVLFTFPLRLVRSAHCRIIRKMTFMHEIIAAVSGCSHEHTLLASMCHVLFRKP